MGDWAEGVVHRELNAILRNHRGIKYGNADRIIAGDPTFRDFYAAYQDELRSTGKRPDLLVLPSARVVASWHDDIANLSREELRGITPQAIAGIEVRSSKYYAIKYAEARAAEGRASARQVQSFTPKLEDLRVVKRWIDSFGVPHFYVQVFYDSIYAIPFEQILTVIACEPDNFEVERNANNQEKPTIHIPITSGVQLARFTTEPSFTAQTHLTKMFRMDAYVVPTGGTAPMDRGAVERLLGI